VSFNELVGFTEGDGGVGIVAFSGAEGENEHLVFAVMDEGIEFRDHLDTFLVGKFTLEHGILEVLPIAVHLLEDLSKPFVIRDIVCYKIYSSHASILNLNSGFLILH